MTNRTGADGLEKRVHDAVLAQGAAYIHEDTVVSIDPSAMIRDIAHAAGRRGIYHVAFRSGGREVDVPVS